LLFPHVAAGKGRDALHHGQEWAEHSQAAHIGHQSVAHLLQLGAEGDFDQVGNGPHVARWVGGPGAALILRNTSDGEDHNPPAGRAHLNPTLSRLAGRL